MMMMLQRKLDGRQQQGLTKGTKNDKAAVSTCIFDGSINEIYGWAGGIVGDVFVEFDTSKYSAKIEKCISAGTITAKYKKNTQQLGQFGGILANNIGNTVLKDNLNLSTVTGPKLIGGIVGTESGSVGNGTGALQLRNQVSIGKVTSADGKTQAAICAEILSTSGFKGTRFKSIIQYENACINGLKLGISGVSGAKTLSMSGLGNTKNYSGWTNWKIVKGCPVLKDSYFDKYQNQIQKAFTKAMTTKISAKNTTAGIKLNIGKMSGVEGYVIYRKTGSGAYKQLTVLKGSSKTSYYDKKASNGKKYTYKAVAYKGSVKYNSANTATVTRAKSLSKPSKVKATKGKKSNTVVWAKNTKSTGYYVYRKAGTNGKWARVAYIKKSTTVKYVDKKVKNGTKYSYKIKAYNGSVISGYSKTVTVKR